MALTNGTYPNRIDNSAIFNVTTDLVEDSTHVNLRVRGGLYHEGIIKATVEKPKGLTDFDFGNILKSLTPGLLFPRDSGDITKTGTIGANLITDWSVQSGAWDTFTSAGVQITAAVIAAGTSAFLMTNNIAMTAGDIYVFYAPDLATSGVVRPYQTISTLDHNADNVYANRGIIIMPITTGNKKIHIGSSSGQLNFSGTFYLYKITTNRLTIGNPLAPYFVNFTEIYEDAAGVTTTGASLDTIVHRYVPAAGDGTAFTELVLHDNTCLFANKTLRNNVSKWYSDVPREYWITFFTTFVECELFYSKDGAGAVHTTHPVCYEGWGVIILNVGEILATVVTSLAIYLKETTGAGTVISETLTVYPNALQIAERAVLEFDGLLGGKEYLAFEGVKELSYQTTRKYYTASTGVKKPLSFIGVTRQKLETLFKDMANASYLKSLLGSENVKKLDAAYVVTDVTVLTDSVKTDLGVNMFTNQIEIEY